jgi:hypothetical protein
MEPIKKRVTGNNSVLEQVLACTKTLVQSPVQKKGRREGGKKEGVKPLTFERKIM